jgi:hypothetical protein
MLLSEAAAVNLVEMLTCGRRVDAGVERTIEEIRNALRPGSATLNGAWP